MNALVYQKRYRDKLLNRDKQKLGQINQQKPPKDNEIYQVYN